LAVFVVVGFKLFLHVNLKKGANHNARPPPALPPPPPPPPLPIAHCGK
jgi:hypothetical protein